jgi:hypothetical protein
MNFQSDLSVIVLLFKLNIMGNIVIQFSIEKMSQVQYDLIISGLEAAGLGTIPGRIFHVAAPDGDGWHVTDVWESEEAFKKFAETMVPIMISTGVEPADPFVLPVHNIIVP